MLKVNSIKWHEENIENVKLYVYRQSKLLLSKILKLNGQKADLVFYKNQVREAKKRKKNFFDASKFLKKLKPKIKSDLEGD